MKTIGIIGGLSWQSSSEYYKLLNEYTAKYLGDSHSGKIILYSIDFHDVAKYSHEENWDAIAGIMKTAAVSLEKAGADMIILATNTIHLVSDAITSSISIPFLHIAQATGKAITKKGLKKVGLLGTKYTMEKDFYTKYLKDHFNIQVVIPNTSDRQLVHDIIYNELVKGKFTKNSKKITKDIIEKMEEEEQIEGVILGCTELPILLPEGTITIPSFNTMNIHVLETIEHALKESLFKVS